MLTAIIIDDETNSAESLGILVRENCPGVKIKSVETDPLAALERMKKVQPDLLFLDIEMPGLSGFELLAELNQPLPKVIFTTAYNQYAVQAFRHNAIDYLMKPVIVSELVSAVNKLHQRIKAEAVLKSETNQSVAIPIQSQNEIITVTAHDIIRLEADSNYTHIYLTNGRRITSAKTLKDYEQQLDPAFFFRVHKTNLINTKQVKRYMRGENAYVIMQDDSHVDVARRKKSDFLLCFFKGKI